MRQIGIRELRDNLTTVIREVEKGEPVEVTRDGRAVALITSAPESRLDRLIAEGVVSPAEHKLRRFAPRPSRSGISGTEAIQQDRGD